MSNLKKWVFVETQKGEKKHLAVMDVEDQLLHLIHSTDILEIEKGMDLKVCGVIHADAPYHKSASLVAESLHTQKTVDTNETFYIMGKFSEIDDLQYVQLNDKVMIGTRKSGEGQMNARYASVYFLKNLGSIRDYPVFYYASDMVVHDNQIKWVAGDFTNREDHPTQVLTR